MDPQAYQQTKSELQTIMLQLLDKVGWTDQAQIEEWILHYLEHDEPQIAYTNLVTMIVQSGQTLSQRVYVDIINLGKDLQITDGITWDALQTQAWWAKLKSLAVFDPDTT